MKTSKLVAITLLLLTAPGPFPSPALATAAGNGGAATAANTTDAAPGSPTVDGRVMAALVACGFGYALSTQVPGFRYVGPAFCAFVVDVLF